jgi:hypothetical protein
MGLRFEPSRFGGAMICGFCLRARAGTRAGFGATLRLGWYAPEARSESAGAFDAAQHAVIAGFIGTCGVLPQFALDFGIEVDAGHLGQAREVDEDVGKFLAQVGQALPPGGERFTDLGGQQPELQRNIVDVEAFGELVLPGLV